MLVRIERAGLDFEPRIIIVTRLIPVNTPPAPRFPSPFCTPDRSWDTLSRFSNMMCAQPSISPTIDVHMRMHMH